MTHVIGIFLTTETWGALKTLDYRNEPEPSVRATSFDKAIDDVLAQVARSARGKKKSDASRILAQPGPAGPEPFVSSILHALERVYLDALDARLFVEYRTQEQALTMAFGKRRKSLQRRARSNPQAVEAELASLNEDDSWVRDTTDKDLIAKLHGLEVRRAGHAWKFKPSERMSSWTAAELTIFQVLRESIPRSTRATLEDWTLRLLEGYLPHGWAKSGSSEQRGGLLRKHATQARRSKKHGPTGAARMDKAIVERLGMKPKASKKVSRPTGDMRGSGRF